VFQTQLMSRVGSSEMCVRVYIKGVFNESMRGRKLSCSCMTKIVSYLS